MTLIRNAHLLTVLAASLFAAQIALSNEKSLVTAVFSTVSNGYTRKLAANGAPKPEYYALARGKFHPGISKDRFIDDVDFSVISAKVIDVLKRENYLLAENSRSAELLVTITWGTTQPFSNGTYRNNLDTFISSANLARQTAQVAAADNARSANGIQSESSALAQAAQSELEGQLIQMQMFESMRMKANEYNGRLLGYIDEINYRNVPSRFGGSGHAFDELIEDIENERYFVIIAAYDFQQAVKEHKFTPRWITRVSIQRQGNRFDRDIGRMLTEASRYFGRQSGRLVRQYQEGEVTIGEMRVIGPAEEPKADQPAPTPERR